MPELNQPKHTPGPWQLNRTTIDGVLVGWHIAASEHGSSLPIAVADKFGVHRDPEQEEANAKLIAAAPDLLEVCMHLVEAIELNYADMKPGIANYLRTIIEGHEGKSSNSARAAIAKAQGEPHA